MPNSRLRTSLGHAEVDEARFHDRVDDDDLPAAAADLHQRAHQPRMVAGRVAADDETPGRRCSTSSSVTVAVPVPSDACQADAAGLVAVVAAVVDVVRAVQPGEKLQQKAGFVASCGR